MLNIRIQKGCLLVLLLASTASGQKWVVTKTGASGQQRYSAEDIMLVRDTLRLAPPVTRYGVSSPRSMTIPLDQLMRIRYVPALAPFFTLISFAGGWYAGFLYGRQLGEKKIESGDWFEPARWALLGSTIGGGLAGFMAKELVTTTYDFTGMTHEQNADSIQTILATHP
jgi:hypothetical protein